LGRLQVRNEAKGYTPHQVAARRLQLERSRERKDQDDEAKLESPAHLHGCSFGTDTH